MPRYRNRSAKPAEKFVNKYELTKESKIFRGETVYRIRALKDFGSVKKGELGGYVSGEHNLSQYGSCWIAHEAIAYQHSQVRVFAQIIDRAMLGGNAIAAGGCVICNDAIITGDADVADEVTVGGGTIIGGKIKLRGDVQIYSQGELMAYVEERRAAMV